MALLGGRGLVPFTSFAETPSLPSDPLSEGEAQQPGKHQARALEVNFQNCFSSQPLDILPVGILYQTGFFQNIPILRYKYELDSEHLR